MLALTPPQVQRGHRVAEGVPHGDPALHRRDGRQRAAPRCSRRRRRCRARTCARPGRPATWPRGLSATPTSSARPMPAVCGTEPTASRTCEPATSRPSSSRTRTPSPTRSADAARERFSTCMPRSAEDVLDDGRRVGVLAGQHPVARGDQHDLAAEAEVGVGQLGAGDARADDDELLGQLLQVVDLLPGEDALAVGHAPRPWSGASRRWRPARRRPRAPRSRRSAHSQLHPPGRDHPARPRGRPAPRRPRAGSAMSCALGRGETQHAGVDRLEVGRSRDLVGRGVLEAAPPCRRRPRTGS